LDVTLTFQEQGFVDAKKQFDKKKKFKKYAFGLFVVYY